MEIQVTQEDISNGVPQNHLKCAVARALRRAFPDSPVEVGYWIIRVGYQLYSTTQEIEEFLSAYDLGLPVKPFAFDLGKLPLFADYGDDK